MTEQEKRILKGLPEKVELGFLTGLEAMDVIQQIARDVRNRLLRGE